MFTLKFEHIYEDQAGIFIESEYVFAFKISPDPHRSTFSRKIVNGLKAVKYFCKKPYLKMFDRLLHTPLVWYLPTRHNLIPVPFNSENSIL